MRRPQGLGGISKTVLHVGSGHASEKKLHACFDRRSWREIRIDIDPSVKPDVVSDQMDVLNHFPARGADAIWSSHSLEHLRRHELPVTLKNFSEVLKRDGFCLVRCPDLQVICEMILNGKIDDVAYNSPAGPITPLEMLYGHGASIARGDRHMEHKTGFTAERLGNAFLEAGFEEVRVSQHHPWDLWAVAFMEEAPVDALLDDLAATGLPFAEKG